MTSPIPVVLVELGSQLRWDDTRLGSGLTLSAPDAVGWHTVTRTGATADRSAMTRVCLGSWVAVIKISALPAGGSVAVGVRTEQRAGLRVVNRSRDQDVKAGTNAGTYGITSAGLKFTAGASVATGTTWANGDQFVLLYDALNRTLRVRKNASGVDVATWAGISGPFQLVGSPITLGSALQLMGDVDLVPASRMYRPAGVWGRVSNIGWTTPHADSKLRDTYFDGRIDPDNAPRYSLRAAIPLLDRGRPERATGSFSVINVDRELDAWLDWSTRDEVFTIRTGTVAQTYSDFAVAATGLIDLLGSAPSDEGKIVITPRDAAASLDVPYQVNQYPSTAALDALKLTTKPTGVGELHGVPVTMVDAANLLYDLIDDAAYTVSAVYDRGVPLTAGVGYSLSNDRSGIKRLTNPAGKQVVDMVGAVTDSTIYVDSVLGDFAPWAGSPAVPAGWDRGFTGAGASVTNAAPGARFQAPSGGVFASLHIAYLFATQAMNLRIDITVSARTSGTLNIRLTDFGSNAIDTQVSAAGTYTFFVLKTAPMHGLQLFSNFATADFTVTRLRITRVEAMDGLSAWMKHLVTDRGPLPIEQLDVGGIATIAAARPWPLCLYTGQDSSVKVSDILDQTAASIGGGWYVTASGVVSLMLLAITIKGSERLLTDVELVGELRRDPVTGLGLSDRVACVPFWAPHGDGDIADSVLTTPAGRQRAEEFKRKYLATRKGSTRLADAYVHGTSADPITSLLATATGGQGLADVITDFFRVPRGIYVGTAVLDDGPFRPGEVIVVQSNQYDLAAGKPLLVIGAEGEHGDSVADLILLG